MATEIKETAQNQPKRNKSQEHKYEEEKEGNDSLDASIGANSKRSLSDTEINHVEPTKTEETGLTLNLENLKNLTKNLTKNQTSQFNAKQPEEEKKSSPDIKKIKTSNIERVPENEKPQKHAQK